MSYKEGDIVSGSVVAIKPYGAFVSISNNITGLLHISEISDKYVKDINSVLKKNDSIEVKIIKIDEENHYIFSIKQIYRGKRKTFHNSVYKKREKIMETKKGFSQLEKNLPIWIKEFQGE